MIKVKFIQHHAMLITNGYKSVGMQAPDFSQLSRKDCLKAVAEFERRVGSMATAPAEAAKLVDELVNGLRELKPIHIPSNWI